MNKQDMDYMGDGVYVGHDGYQLWLTTCLLYTSL